jgi:RNA polymerase sigma-70 factor (ECF subfamily)
MPDTPDDFAPLLQRWRAGDEAAGEELIRLLYPVISRIVRVHLPRRDDESDLVQEILMKTFSRLHQYQATAPLTHWVSRIALTTCLDRLRAQKVRPEVRWSDLTPAESEVFDTTWLEGAISSRSCSRSCHRPIAASSSWSIWKAVPWTRFRS